MTPHGAIVIALGGSPHGEPPSGGQSTLGMLRLPKDFDPGDSQPGDEIEVTVKGKLSPDGKALEVMSVDGSMGEEETEESEGEMSDDEETPGDRWAKIRKPSDNY